MSVTQLFTADQLEAIFHAALKAGDAQSTVDALKLMVTVDPSRCERLLTALTTALDIAHEVDRG